MVSASKKVHLLILSLFSVEIQASETHNDGCVKQEGNLG